jgi:hypothetical protein
MNQIGNNISHIFTNLHVSVPVAIAAGLAVAQVWLPHYAAQLNATAIALGGYGIIAAANTPAASQTPPAPKA